MKYFLAELTWGERKPLIDVFNYYIENSYAAYLEKKVGYDFFDILWNTTTGYPRISIKNSEGEFLGFAFLRPYSPMTAFQRTAELSCFIMPQYTGKGAGKAAVNWLINEAKNSGIETIMASISSLNTESIDFHSSNGFKKCGLFEGIGIKFGKKFDVVWMQKKIS